MKISKYKCSCYKNNEGDTISDYCAYHSDLEDLITLIIVTFIIIILLIKLF